MSLKSPFLVEDSLFEHSSDYAMALTYFSKLDKFKVKYRDLENTLKYFNVNSNIDESIFNKYINNINYIELLPKEKQTMRELINIKNSFVPHCDEIDNYIHTFNHNENDISKLIKFAVCVDYKYGLDNLVFESTLKYIFKKNKDFSFYKNYQSLDETLKNINRDFYDAEIENYLQDKEAIDILELMGIDKIEQLIRCNLDIIYIVLSRDIVNSINNLKQVCDYDYNTVNQLISLLDDIYMSLPSKIINILFLRNGVFEEEKTLEEIGSMYGVTRERIRQIESKGIKRLAKHHKALNETIIATIKARKITGSYLFKKDVQKMITNPNHLAMLIVLLKNTRCLFCYDDYFEMFYIRNRFNEIIDVQLLKMPHYIKMSDIEQFDEFGQKIFNNRDYYKIVKDHIYLRKEYPIKSLYLDTIDDLFPGGFKEDDTNIKILNDELQERYDLEVTNVHGLYNLINRNNYCLIDRGTYINRSFIAPLSESLTNRILDYIDNYGQDVIYYSTIYANFKDDLMAEGVNNRYHLKGLLDLLVPSDYITQRDFISIGDTFKTGTEGIYDVISSINGKFDLNDLRQALPGIRDHVFLRVVRDRGDVLWYEYGNKFYRYECQSVTNEFVDTIKQELDYLFNKTESSVISVSKIYARMRMMRRDLMANYSYLDNSFVFFSFISKYLSGDYYLKRPFISNSTEIELNYRSIINSYVNTKDYFNPSILSAFCNKIHIGTVNSYLDFMIDMSDEYIQVDEENCVKKEKLNIRKEQIDSIEYELNYYINSFGPIYTSKGFYFESFPNIGFKWSKYLLVGFIRSYLNDKFDIEYTTSFYKTTDFIIKRRIENE